MEAYPAHPGKRDEYQFHQLLQQLTPNVYITPIIIALNVGVFVIMAIAGVNVLEPTIEDLLAWGADYGPKTVNGQWWRLLTCTFIHIGLIHLLFNMWVLGSAGCIVERLVGNAGFLVLYVFSGLVGSLASIYWNPEIVSAGASGAVFGVFGALLGFLALGRGSVSLEQLASLRNSTLGFLGFNLLFGLSQENIDMAAHAGGLAGGFVCGLVLSQPLTREATAARLKRNMVMVVVAIVVVAAGVVLLPKDVADIQGELIAFAKTEERVLDTYNQAVKRSQQNLLSQSELLQVLEKEVLPPWRDALQKLDAMQNLPRAQQAILSRLLRYMKLREESWELLAESIRTDDPAKAEASQEKARAADRIVETLQ